MNNNTDHYRDPTDPAPDINSLIDYLERLDSGDQYIYRGQVKDWGTPLLPSLYRSFIPLEQTFTCADPEYRYSLRRIGGKFVKLLPDSALMKFLEDFAEFDLLQQDLALLQRIASHPEIERKICELGFRRVIKEVVSPEYANRLTRTEYIGLYKAIVDDLCRISIRHTGLLNPLGYLLGMTLAQQYGFSSELLDFTADIKVAAFFATHTSPEFLWENSKKQILDSDHSVGVIYRLPSTKGQLIHHRLDEYDYYTCPGQIHLEDLCRRFEDRSAPDMHDDWFESLPPSAQMALANATIVIPNPLEDIQSLSKRRITVSEAIEKYFELYCNYYVRFFRLLDFPKGTFEGSRLGRQKAVVIIPDEIRQTVFLRNAEDYASLQAVEDISWRKGFDRFYFRHSDVCPNLGAIDREYLWPHDGDVFLQLVQHPIDPSTPQYFYGDGRSLLKRKDLIAGGYFDKTENDIILPSRPAQKKDYSHLVARWEEIELSHHQKYYNETYQYVFQAALFCQKGFLESGDFLIEARSACDHVLSLIDSFTINLLKHIIIIGLGDIGQEYTLTWSRAIELANGDQEMVASCFKDLWYRRSQRTFRQRIIQYFDDFG